MSVGRTLGIGAKLKGLDTRAQAKVADCGAHTRCAIIALRPERSSIVLQGGVPSPSDPSGDLEYIVTWTMGVPISANGGDHCNYLLYKVRTTFSRCNS